MTTRGTDPAADPAADAAIDPAAGRTASRAPVYAVPFAALRAADLPLVGGKGANLGELAAAGFPVPDGFCVTTDAFRRFMAGDGALAAAVYAELEALAADDVAGARALGASVRSRLAGLPMPDDVAAAVVAAWSAIEARGDGGAAGDAAGAAYAVRSSATAEDLPGASFAGQQDSYLGVRGRDALLDAVKRCWISLFTDRAILYRAQNGFGHRDIALSVVVQRMIAAEVSGILFTADPVTGHRGVASIDAGFGLGEALVGGLVTADLYRVDQRRWQVVERRIAHKALAIRPRPDGGTARVELADDDGARPSLTDDQAVALARLGARVAAHYGAPQDIEWCLDAAAAIWLVQSRPITTLFPVPALAAPSAPGAPHLFISFGHVQVMTDPFTPIGRDAFRLVFPFDRAAPLAPSRIVAEAAGRLFVDLAPLLASPAARRMVPRAVTVADAQIAAALAAVVARPEVAAALSRQPRAVRGRAIARFVLPLLGRAVAWLAWRDVDGAAAALAGVVDADVAASGARVAAAPGPARLAVAEHEVATVFARMLPRFIPVIAAAMMCRLLLLRLGVAPADVAALLRGLRGNVTTDMDLAVGDLADVARGHTALVALLTSRPPAEALAAADAVEGGPAFRAALDAFLARYGMRGGGEIDLGRTRWADDPSPLVAVIAGNLAHAEAGAHRAHHDALVAAGEAAVARVAAAAGRGWLGPVRRPIVRRLARALRGLMAVREHPKFALIRTFGLLRAALADAAAPLAAAGRFEAADDVWLLRLDEVKRAAADAAFDPRPIVAERRSEMARFAAVRPPRLVTGDGEIPEVSVATAGAPDGALVGTAASAGVVEGIARVVTDPSRDVLYKGEILVAPFTDPGWTPLFINAAGLVMEVGGLMTHGSVVAREYGIPAVVGVPDALARLATGMRVRVNGDRGWVEVVAGGGGDQAP